MLQETFAAPTSYHYVCKVCSEAKTETSRKTC